MPSFGYWLKRFLHRFWKHRFIPSFYFCATCGHHVQKNHFHKKPEHSTVSLGLKLKKGKTISGYTFRMKHPTKKEIPDKVDWSPVLFDAGWKIRDQGNQGSCTAQCGGTDKDFQEIQAGTWPGLLSAAFLYYKEREDHGWEDEDTGAEMIDIWHALRDFGICTNQTMPYDDKDWTTPPTDEAYEEAKGYVVKATRDKLRNDELLEALVDGPIEIGVPVYESFMEAMKNGGFIPNPDVENEGLLGGHAMFVSGYDKTKLWPDGTRGALLILNSWGTSVGNRGKFYMKLDFMDVCGEGNVDNQQLFDSEIPSPNPHICPEGQHWDEAQQKCVPDTPPVPDWVKFLEELIKAIIEFLNQNQNAYVFQLEKHK